MEAIELLSPTVKRALSAVGHKLKEGRVAFFLGAGVDIALSNGWLDAGKMPNWLDLVTNLYKEAADGDGKYAASDMELKNTIELWPSEVASIVRCWKGDQAFFKSLSDQLEVNKKKRPHLVYSDKLCGMLCNSNLIVTTNYSKLIVDVLRDYIKRHKLGKDIIIYNREDLPSFYMPRPSEIPNKIYILYLHGRCYEPSYPILDAWGYSLVENDDRYYFKFLQSLFNQRSIVFIGFSWKDILIRRAAAMAQTNQQYILNSHLSLDKRDSIPEKCSLARRLSNAMRAAYGITMIQAREEDQTKLIETICSQAEIPKSNSLKKIAEYFDYCGDFESPMHYKYLMSISKKHNDSPKERISQGIIAIVNLLKRELAKDINHDKWLLCARVERHLRHHLWLYCQENKAEGNRGNVWKDLFNKSRIVKWAEIPDRIKFDFIVGGYETGVITNKLEAWLSKKPAIKPSDPVFQDRLDCVYRIYVEYNNKDTPTGKYDELISSLLRCGWESMAAKVMCDKVSALAEKAKSTATITPAEILQNAQRAEAIARTIGCIRRRVKADILAAMWDPNPVAARERLLRRLMINNHGWLIEPGLVYAIGIGLLACQIQIKPDGESMDTEEVNEFLSSYGLAKEIGNIMGDRYWTCYMPNTLVGKIEKIRSNYNKLRK